MINERKATRTQRGNLSNGNLSNRVQDESRVGKSNFFKFSPLDGSPPKSQLIWHFYSSPEAPPIKSAAWVRKLNKLESAPPIGKVMHQINTLFVLYVEDVDYNGIYAVFVSYVEVYNERIYDLLDPNGVNKTK